MRAYFKLTSGKFREAVPIFYLAVTVGALTLCGCSAINGYPARSGSTKAELKQLDVYYQTNVLATYGNKTGDDRKRYRDEVINGRVRAVDLHFEDFERTLAKSSVFKNIGVDWTVLALNAAGVIVPAANSKAIFSGISGGLVGANGSVDKNAFYEKTLPALLAKMEALRKQQLLVIRQGITLSPDDYSLNQGLADVDVYYQAGTIPGAIMDITGDAGATNKAATAQIAKIAQIQSAYFADAAGDLLRKFWKPDGKTVNPDNEAKLQAEIKKLLADWMKAHAVDDVSVPLFIRGKDFGDARTQAVKELGL